VASGAGACPKAARREADFAQHGIAARLGDDDRAIDVFLAASVFLRWSGAMATLIVPYALLRLPPTRIGATSKDEILPPHYMITGRWCLMPTKRCLQFQL